MKVEFLESQEFRDKFNEDLRFNHTNQHMRPLKEYIRGEIEKLVDEKQREAFWGGRALKDEKSIPMKDRKWATFYTWKEGNA